MSDEVGGSKSDESLASTQPCGKRKYGGLFLLGCNGSLPNGERGRKRSKFILEERDLPNGVKKANVSVVTNPKSSKAVQDHNSWTISFTISKDESIIVECAHDKETDMFQIGRSYNKIIDYVVLDKCTGEGKMHQSTISRFACRIIASRSDQSDVKLFAAGFGGDKNIFLGEKAVKWKTSDGTDVDALTTNGVLLCNPNGSYSGGELEAGLWREVSVFGSIFSIRGFRSSQEKGRKIEGGTNILRDGSLIDLCGATLLWRSAEGLEKCVTKDYIEKLVEMLNEDKDDKLDPLVIPRKSSSSDVDSDSADQPSVFLNCGHIHGGSAPPKQCPSCHKIGPSQKICMGMEGAFYIDDVDDPHPVNLFAFNPCGHIATEKTVKYWSTVSVPHGTSAFQAICPFCATELQGNPGYVNLKFNQGVK
ncbi:protein pellino-like isoform X1 [Thrips palmi]|uniref:Protein pellino-like isoform X1 n=1 Tax=Thrips palmi TaxID=161013 RepID=A0A6P8ZQ52_THRPL|nr:protein pellino-like isoform X1 [Thrips palmi]